MNEFALDLHSCGILRSVERKFLTDVSGQPIGPIFKCQESGLISGKTLGYSAVG